MSCISSKTCTLCGLTKPIAEFHKLKHGKDGLHSRCKSCEAVRNKEWYRRKCRTPEYIKRQRNNRLIRQFGIDDDGYEILLEMQGGRCGICGCTDSGRKGADRFAIDHSHETGAVRGLLCSRCNQALGLFGDNPDVLRKAAEYLERHNERQPQSLHRIQE